MIYIFAQESGVERILAYKTHFEASAILIKEKRDNRTFDKDWKIEESFLIPLHLLNLINAKVCADTAKTTSLSEDEDDDDDNQSCNFDLAHRPQQNSFDGKINDDVGDKNVYWREETICKDTSRLKLELRRKFHCLEKQTLSHFEENSTKRMEMQEYLLSFWRIPPSCEPVSL